MSIIKKLSSFVAIILFSMSLSSNAAVIDLDILDINSKGGVVSKTLDAGHYQFTPTDTLGSYTAWNNLNGGTPGFWRWSYHVIIPEINNGNEFEIGGGVTYLNASIAYANAITYDFILTATQTVMLYNKDPYKLDNVGGVSLVLQSVLPSSSVPSPSTLALFLIGILALFLKMTHQQKRT